MEISEINFLDIQKNEQYLEIINKVLNKCYEKENLKEKNLYIDIILTNAKNIRELNKKYRDIDKETDVLSFPMFEKEEIPKLNNTHDVLGDVVISIEQVEKQAKEYGHSFERELSYMVVHSFYHLLGYDHMEEDDRVIMRQKEDEVLKELKMLR